VRFGGKHESVKRDRAIRLTGGLRQDKFDRKKDTDALHIWAAQRSFDVFRPVWRQARGKNWHITLHGTAVNDSFGAEVADSGIKDELLREAVEDRQVKERVERAEQQRRQQMESERRQQEAERRRQEEQERQRVREQGASKQQ
jgi:hypothetical protein